MFLFPNHLDILENIAHDHYVLSSFIGYYFRFEGSRVRLVKEILLIHRMNDGFQVVNCNLLMIVKGIGNNANFFIVNKVLPHLFVCDFTVKEYCIK